MAETWTEYAVRFGKYDIIRVNDRAHADRLNRDNYNLGTIVGRQVTASDWLPVDQGGAS